MEKQTKATTKKKVDLTPVQAEAAKALKKLRDEYKDTNTTVKIDGVDLLALISNPVFYLTKSKKSDRIAAALINTVESMGLVTVSLDDIV